MCIYITYYIYLYIKIFLSIVHIFKVIYILLIYIAYYMSSAILNPLNVLTNLIFIKPICDKHYYNFHLQMRKLKHREV